MKTIHHTQHTSDPFDYDEYKNEPIVSFDWPAIIIMTLFALAFVGVIFKLV